MPGTSSVNVTRDQDVNGVLSGVEWSTNHLTYSFPDSGSYYGSDYGWGAGEPEIGFDTLGTLQQTAVRAILSMISSIANVTFSEITETATRHADLRLANTQATPFDTAWAYGVDSQDQGGDTWYGSTYDYTAPVTGNYAYHTFMHELGHSLGLKHGHEAGGFGAMTSAHDSMEYSVMTYRSYVGQAEIGNYMNDVGGYAQTLMMYDIAALQYMYGANYSTNSGNSTYSWDAETGAMSINGIVQALPVDNHVFMTVWDGGGNDTYDFSSYFGNTAIDLRPGEWSTTSDTQLANLGDGHLARGNIANALLFEGDVRSLIENAIGGAGNNEIIGNDAANMLRGGGGSDTLWGNDGNDSLLGEGDADVLVGGAGNDTLDGGTGYDGASYYYSSGAVSADLAATAVADGMGGTDKLIGIEVVYGSAFGDTLLGSALGDELIGNSGDDALNGRDGNDQLTGGAGNDTLVGGKGFDSANYFDAAGAVLVNLKSGSATDGGGGFDSLADIERIYGSAFGDTLIGNAAGNELWGNDGADSLSGGGGGDRLEGGAGHDMLDGGAGADTLRGWTGNDVYVVDDASDVIVEEVGHGADLVKASISFTLAANVENLLLTGTAALVGTGNSLANTLTGNSGKNRLSGLGGNDLLDGGTGSDTLIGGLGNDSYVVDVAGDVVIEAANAGTDTVRSLIAYVLSTNLENLTLTGSAAIAGTGNALANVLIGNGAGNRLNGLAGDDMLDGGAGADTMVGGRGNDLYIVSSTGDVVTETANAGNDTVQSAIAYELGANVENLILSGIADIGGTGNALANMISGNDASNTLSGGGGGDMLSGQGGNDTLNGDSGSDTLYGDAGNDVLFGGSGSDKLDGGTGYDGVSYFYAQAGISLDLVTQSASDGLGGTDTLIGIEVVYGSAFGDTLIGDAADNEFWGNGGADALDGGGGQDALIGGEGNDTLDGGAGADTLTGWTGDDIYVVDSLADTVIEEVGYGTDTIRSLITVTMAANVEILVLTGTDGIAGTGNELSNALTGNSGDNTLIGGLGLDTLAGGSGADRFVWSALADSGDTAALADMVLDFSGAAGDRLDFSALDANSATANNDAFSFIGSAAFSAPGQVATFSFGGDLYLALNVDANVSTIDMLVVLANVTSFNSGWLIA